jgi:hypothetical protein
LKGFEPLAKAVICHWPDEWGGPEARWEWPFAAMNEPANRAKDSCVVFYWNNLDLKPDAKRTLAYTYGLGQLAGKMENDKVRLLVGGGAAVGGTFTITAYVKGGADKAKLELPDGLKLADGQKAEQAVTAQKGIDYAQVSWLVKASKEGGFTVQAKVGDQTVSREVFVYKTSLFE